MTAQRTQGLGYKPDDVRKKFATYERDTETNLDFAQARYFNAGFGRFSTPDYFVNDTHVTDPQSWNLYGYARNNPLRYSDPSGTQVLVEARDKDGNLIVLEYRDGKLYNTTNRGSGFEAGDEYAGDNATALKILKDLNTLAGIKELRGRLDTLVNSKKTHFVNAGEGSTTKATEDLPWTEGKPSNTETTYNTEKDDDGGTNTFIPLARELLGRAYNIGNGNDTSSVSGREERNSDEYARLRTENKIGVMRENPNSIVDAVKQENIARKFANLSTREVRDEGTSSPGFQPPPEKKLPPLPPLPKPVNPSERKRP